MRLRSRQLTSPELPGSRATPAEENIDDREVEENTRRTPASFDDCYVSSTTRIFPSSRIGGARVATRRVGLRGGLVSVRIGITTTHGAVASYQRPRRPSIDVGTPRRRLRSDTPAGGTSLRQHLVGLRSG